METVVFSLQKHIRFVEFVASDEQRSLLAPLDCPCQGASSESKKIYLDFSVLE
jgi:hypothetical protein